MGFMKNAARKRPGRLCARGTGPWPGAEPEGDQGAGVCTTSDNLTCIHARAPRHPASDTVLNNSCHTCPTSPHTVDRGHEETVALRNSK
eukprot:1901972-Prymnesium_polylepis.1